MGHLHIASDQSRVGADWDAEEGHSVGPKHWTIAAQKYPSCFRSKKNGFCKLDEAVFCKTNTPMKI